VVRAVMEAYRPRGQDRPGPACAAPASAQGKAAEPSSITLAGRSALLTPLRAWLVTREPPPPVFFFQLIFSRNILGRTVFFRLISAKIQQAKRTVSITNAHLCLPNQNQSYDCTVISGSSL